MDYTQLQLIKIVSKNGRINNRLYWIKGIVINYILILKREIIIDY